MATTYETLAVSPHERRPAIRELIDSARQDLRLSIFRCDDFSVLDGLAIAVERGVRVRALLTPHAKNWKKRLQELEFFLASMGVEVRRYAGAGAKYHAKYMLADEGPALIASLNFTRKCFDQTCDFVVTTNDASVASSLSSLFEADWQDPAGVTPQHLSVHPIPRLIVGPDHARARFSALIQRASRSIRIIDHRLSDPRIVSMLRMKQDSGVVVEVLGQGSLRGLISHGRMLLIDDEASVIGSIALSQASLERRREVAVEVDGAAHVTKLKLLFESFAREVPARALALSEFAAVSRDGPEDDDDSD